MTEPVESLGDLVDERFGIKTAIGRTMPAEGPLAQILSRTSKRKYQDKPVTADLLNVLLACAQSAPAKSDLQQYSIVVVENWQKRRTLSELTATSWLAKAPVLLVFCADMRRIQRLAEIRGHAHRNNNLDTFMNGAVDAALAMQSFITAAEAVGLGCCPISAIRNRMDAVCALLELPPGVFPIAGLCAGWPAEQPGISMRLPPAVVVHRDRYDDSGLEAEIEAYDRRRHARKPIPPEKQRHTDKYGILDFCSWSENVTRQLSLPERANFMSFLRSHGYKFE